MESHQNSTNQPHQPSAPADFSRHGLLQRLQKIRPRKFDPRPPSNLRQTWMRTDDRLAELIDGDCPDLLIANAVLSLWAKSWAYCGRDMAEAWGDWINERMRTYNGLCQHCDSKVNPSRTNLPICEHCDAKLDAEVREVTGE